MNHRKVVAAMGEDPTFCRECGGWLGRKNGVKPYCTQANCPGRFAVMSPEPKRGAVERTVFSNRDRDDEEESGIKASAASRTKTPPPAPAPRVVPPPPAAKPQSPPPAREASQAAVRVPSASKSRRSLDSDLEALPPPPPPAEPPSPLPSLSLLVPVAACSALSVGWAYYAFELESEGDQMFALLATCTVLLLATPPMQWLRASSPLVDRIMEAIGQAIHHTLAYAAAAANLIALFILVAEPMVPQPGSETGYSTICLDVVAWAIRFDKTLVLGGPCFELGSTYLSASK